MGPHAGGSNGKKAAAAAAQKVVKKNTLKEQRKQKLQTKALILDAVAPGSSKYQDSLISMEEAARRQVNHSTRQLRRVSSEVTANRSLSNNFFDFSCAEVDLVLVHGISLRGALKRDKGFQKLGQLTMGKFYYEDLRSKFRKVDDGKKKLVVNNPKSPVPPALWQALDMLTDKVKKCQPFRDWLEATYCSIVELHIKGSSSYTLLLKLHVGSPVFASALTCVAGHSIQIAFKGVCLLYVLAFVGSHAKDEVPSSVNPGLFCSSLPD